jgi:uncharacterized protein YacL
VSLSIERLPCCVPLLFTYEYPNTIGSRGRPTKRPSLLLGLILKTAMLCTIVDIRSIRSIRNLLGLILGVIFLYLFIFFLVKRNYINYALIKRKRVAFDTSKAKASSTYAGALGKEIKSEVLVTASFCK